MKSLLILVLAAALVGGMFLSKPSQANFVTYLNTQNQPAQANSVQAIGKQILGGLISKAAATALTYHDHILWATEDLNGQPQYFGMFAHWWKESTEAAPSAGN